MKQHRMATGVNRVVGQQPLLLEEGAEASHDAEQTVARGGRQAFPLRCLKPGIHIGGGQTRHILPETWLPRGGQEPIEGDQCSEGGLQRFGAVVTGPQVGQVIRHEGLVEGTHKGQPVEGQGVLSCRHTVLLFHAPLLWSVVEEFTSLST